MEPRYLTYVVTTNLLLCGCWFSGSREKGRLRSGNGVLVSVVTQLGVTRPCVGRVPVWFSGVSFQRHSQWQWEVPWPDHLLEIQFPIRNLYGISCRTCHSLMVVTTVWMVAIVGIVRNVYVG